MNNYDYNSYDDRCSIINEMQLLLESYGMANISIIPPSNIKNNNNNDDISDNSAMNDDGIIDDNSVMNDDNIIYDNITINDDNIIDDNIAMNDDNIIDDNSAIKDSASLDAKRKQYNEFINMYDRDKIDKYIDKDYLLKINRPLKWNNRLMIINKKKEQYTSMLEMTKKIENDINMFIDNMYIKKINRNIIYKN